VLAEVLLEDQFEEGVDHLLLEDLDVRAPLL
jgi:hypothetical protein